MINKLDEFAVNGDKAITGLTLTTGFPRQQKPYRQWMNYLFNWVTKKTNEVVDEVNLINTKIDPLLTPIRVGELFITTNSYTTAAQVAERHGYGTWRRFAEGRTLVGYSSSASEMDEYRIMGNQFGANKHKLTISEMPSHTHNLKVSRDAGSGVFAEDAVGNDQISTSKTESSGSDQPHNNIQPSIVVAYWLRTA